MTELAGEVADGALLFVGPASRRDRRRAPPPRDRRAARAAARSPASRVIFIVTLGLAPTVAKGSDWVRRWFEPGRPLLTYPSAGNLHWLREAGLPFAEDLDPTAIDDDLALRVADAFGCFGPPEHCAERLLRAREEAGVEHVFFFPAHDREGGYEMPLAEIEAFERVPAPAAGLVARSVYSSISWPSGSRRRIPRSYSPNGVSPWLSTQRRARGEVVDREGDVVEAGHALRLRAGAVRARQLARDVVVVRARGEEDDASVLAGAGFRRARGRRDRSGGWRRDRARRARRDRARAHAASARVAIGELV